MTRRTTRGHRVATAVPLALVSAAWTTHLAGATPAMSGASAAPAPQADRTLPDGTRLPDAPIDYPASLSQPDEVSAAGDAAFARVAATPSTDDIPAPALAAYQRAESVINAADKTCALGWQLIAAIGRVESDHGRFGGSSLDADGVATPAIVGLALDGRNGTAQINDTDAGQLDADTRFDRAVGPMQFIPSTWAVVGVDADDDGTRNPQDVDDAALAAAVYLCSGDDDLGDDAGRRTAVFRYNHSDAYVEMVLAIMDSYLVGDYASAPPTTVSAGYLPPPTGPSAADIDVALPVHTVQAADQVDLASPVGEQVVIGDPALVDPADPAAPTDGATDEPIEVEVPTDEPDVDPAEPADPGTEVPPTGDPADPADPADPTDPTDPTGSAGEPADPTDPASTEPEPGSLSAEDTDLYCLDQGYVDDLTLTDDDYDLCLVTYTVPPADPADPSAPDSPSSTTSPAGRRSH